MTKSTGQLEFPFSELPLTACNAKATKSAALTSIRPHVNRLQARVLSFLAKRGELGTTDGECQEALGLAPDCERPRRGELCKRGLARDSGAVRKTKAGRLAVVWVITAAGRLVANGSTESQQPAEDTDSEGDFPW